MGWTQCDPEQGLVWLASGPLAQLYCSIESCVSTGGVGASPYWLPQFSWKSEQHQPPSTHTHTHTHSPSNHATPTVARQPDNAGATGCGVCVCVCVRTREFVFCLYAFKISSSETAAEEMHLSKPNLVTLRITNLTADRIRTPQFWFL